MSQFILQGHFEVVSAQEGYQALRVNGRRP